MAPTLLTPRGSGLAGMRSRPPPPWEGAGRPNAVCCCDGGGGQCFCRNRGVSYCSDTGRCLQPGRGLAQQAVEDLAEVVQTRELDEVDDLAGVDGLAGTRVISRTTLAEADGNRTRLTRMPGHTGFEDREGHQAPARLPRAPTRAGRRTRCPVKQVTRRRATGPGSGVG